MLTDLAVVFPEQKKISLIYVVALVRLRPETRLYLTCGVSHLPQYLLHDIEIWESLNKWETKEPLWAFQRSEMLAVWNEFVLLVKACLCVFESSILLPSFKLLRNTACQCMN